MLSVRTHVNRHWPEIHFVANPLCRFARHFALASIFKVKFTFVVLPVFGVVVFAIGGAVFRHPRHFVLLLQAAAGVGEPSRNLHTDFEK